MPVGEEVRTPRFAFRVIHTPGHSDDHICLLEPGRGWAFTGDLFISERAQALRSDEDALLILESLRRLLEHDFEVLFCASGLVTRNARRAVAAKIAFWEDLREKAEELYRAGLGPDEIRERLLGPETALYGLTGGDFAKVHLIRSLLRT
ncbi:MAG: MBL fold metallo-hydrolase [Firmicutes bacterium]|nr:MBL fold metallo-hydrolase [Bacillota bacterium]